jgi:pyruvate/2-oxoglutarate dehydrogenase complex dihydrolipoamide acyltransferase (E2) component
MANEVMRTLSFHVNAIADVDSVIDFSALEAMTIVGVSFCATVLTGTPTATDIDIQDDGTDVIAPRLQMMLGLTYDHRVVDGADADRFMADLKRQLQEFPEGAV